MDEREPWPEKDLQRVLRCPVCSSERRWLQHDELIDVLTPQAPGKWKLWRCVSCACAFLDPRPAAYALGLAYRDYYTHKKIASLPDPSSKFGVLRRSLTNGYRNWRYGSDLRPTLRAGALLLRVLPKSVRSEIDLSLRYLPKMAEPRPYRVLDVGCGSGTFLREAAWAGWDAYGCDFDTEAVAQAVGDGVDVRVGGIEVWAQFENYFDAITFSHVIEHVHDPVQTFVFARTLLKRGGSIYVETPNIDAPLHKCYGRDWRGLEPPRHLVIFTRQALEDVLRRTGFAEIVSQHRPNPSSFLISQSKFIAEKFQRKLPQPASGAASGRAEFITLTAVAV